jgi:ligand-binding SRPBCC domain-containing protein
MPRHVNTVEIPRPVADVFDFLARPANLQRLAPPELRLELVEGPDRLELGSVLHWKARRMGVSQMLVHEVTAFEEGVRIVEEQRRGPLRRWVFAHRFEPSQAGTRLTEEIDYEPPGGPLGLLVGAEAIRQDLETLFAYREKQLREGLG